MDAAFIAKRFGTGGGTERDLFELARRLAGRGHRVTVYCLRADAQTPGVTVVRIPRVAPGRIAAAWSLARIGPMRARAAGHEVIVGFARLLDQDVVRCGGGSHRRYLRRLAEEQPGFRSAVRRCRPQHLVNLAIERRQFSPGHYCKVLAISMAVKREVVEDYGIAPGDVEVIYDGVDTDRFHPARRATDGLRIRREFGLGDDRKIVLFLGNGFRRKGLDVLLEALALGRAAGTACVVVGADPETERYRRQAAARGLSGRVHFAGPRAEPEHFVAAADLLALPARQEAFGNVALEALAGGVPVVISGRAGAAEILTDGLECGVAAEPLTAAGLAQAMDRVWAADSAALGAKARRLAERYTLDENARRVEALLESVIRSRRAQPGGQAP